MNERGNQYDIDDNQQDSHYTFIHCHDPVSIFLKSVTRNNHICCLIRFYRQSKATVAAIGTAHGRHVDIGYNLE